MLLTDKIDKGYADAVANLCKCMNVCCTGRFTGGTATLLFQTVALFHLSDADGFS